MVWSKENEIEMSIDSETTLENFRDYREYILNTKHHNDNAQLLTTTQFKRHILGRRENTFLLINPNSKEH